MTPRDFSRVIPFNNIWPIGFAFHALWTPLIVRQNYVNHGLVDIHLVFYTSFGLLFLLVALVFLREKFDDTKIPYKGICIFSIVCKLYASVVLTTELFAGSEAVAISGSVVGAVGVVASTLVWGSFFLRLPLKQGLAYVLVAYMVNFFLQPVCYLLFPTGAVFVMSLLAIGGPLCLILAQATLPRAATPQPATTDDEAQAGMGEDEAPEKPRRQASFVGVLVAFALYSLVLTLRSPVSFLSGSLIITVLYGIALVCTVVLYGAMIVKQAPPAFERIMQLLLAVFAVGFFLQPFASGIFFDVPPAILMVATALIYMLVWVAVIDIMHLSRIHPFAIVGIWGACYGCPRLLYFILRAFFPIQNDSIEAIVMTALIALFCLFIVFFLVSWHLPKTHSFFQGLRQSDAAAADASLPPSEWQRIAQEKGLTEREREVFYLVCERFSRQYIAKQLFISENTVKAHLKRIYAKLGIHSKYDLERIIKSEQAEK